MDYKYPYILHEKEITRNRIESNDNLSAILIQNHSSIFREMQYNDILREH